MTVPVFIGDPVTAAAYRLAGAAVRTPPAADAGRALKSAIADAPPLIVLSAGHARAIAEETLEEALAALAPPVLIVPDAAGREALPDWGAAIRERIISQ